MKVIDFSEPLCKGAIAFNRIAFLQEEIRESEDSEVVIRMANAGRTGLTFVFLIGCLPLYAEKFNKKLRLLVTPKVYRLLSRINVVDYYQTSTLTNDSYPIDQNSLLKQPAFKKYKRRQILLHLLIQFKWKHPFILRKRLKNCLHRESLKCT